MRKTLAAAAATLFATVGVLAGTTTPAAAAACPAPVILSTTIGPKTVVLGVADPQGITVTTKVRTNGCPIDRVELGLYGPDFVGSYDLHKAGADNGVTVYETGLRLSPGSLPNTEAGRWHSYVTAWGPTVAEKAGPDFELRRAARLTTDAAPEPVRKGRMITVRGKLTRADWDTLHYGGYGRQRVELQWSSPNGTYHLVKRVTGAADGTVRTTVQAGHDGCFRFVFKGNGTTAPVTAKGDCVDVR